MENQADQLSYCGIFCGACPSFGKSCLGCRSDSHDQARVSKWKCKIRACATEEQGMFSCLVCDQFPCDELKRKLIDSHPGDPRFTYRHELPDNRKKFEQLGLDEYLVYQDQKWSCAQCGGRVLFYKYACEDCGLEVGDKDMDTESVI
ncbi:DUF3795 domain-containing protein [bacterium]|nr:DUF3795 domain-containing protein [bacterium]